MVYDGTMVTETIMAHPENDVDALYGITLQKSMDENTFYVGSNYNNEFEFVFWMDGCTNYDVVKFTIMDALISFESWDEVLATLENDFMNGFRQILVACDGDCENCNFCED